MAGVKKVVVVALVIISLAAAEPEFHSFESHYGDDIVARDDMKVDKEEQYMEITITPVKGNLIPTVNLHDFEAGYTAIRDDARETCYVLKAQHTLQEMLDTFQTSVKRDGYFDVQQSFSCTNKKFVDVDHFGDRITRFCDGYEVIFADRQSIGRPTRAIRMMSGRTIFCGICKGWLC